MFQGLASSFSSGGVMHQEARADVSDPDNTRDSGQGGSDGDTVSLPDLPARLAFTSISMATPPASPGDRTFPLPTS